VVIVENNGWAYSTPTERQAAVRDLAERAKAYGMPSAIVDGNDVLKVFEATRSAAKRAREGGGPTFIEAKTMRMKGHAEHDDASYVPKGVLEEWRGKDPVLHYENLLVAKKLLTESEKSAIEVRIEEEIREDLAFAEASPFPPPADAARPVWA